MKTCKIPVNLAQHAYPVYIGEAIYTDKTLLSRHIVGDQVLLLSNETVAPLYLDKLRQALSDYQSDVVLLPDGEAHKNFSSWQKILDVLAQRGHHRDSTLITLGGGVTGDIGGFAAATYQRGIPFIQIPTTLLAQVDASIGGKTAINHAVGKNLIGAFHQPNAVVIDLACLVTLPEREFKAGLAEIVKAALISDSEFFSWLEQQAQQLLAREHDALSHAIIRACEIKQSIVVRDEKESDIRALLNLGHTFGHAIEKLLDYGSWLHGEAVAVGLVLASRLSLHQQRISASDHQRIVNLLQILGLPTVLPESIARSDFMAAMKMDKKVRQGKLRFILLDSIGAAVICDTVSESELNQCL